MSREVSAEMRRLTGELGKSGVVFDVGEMLGIHVKMNVTEWKEMYLLETNQI
jgi:hypothetical protein